MQLNMFKANDSDIRRPLDGNSDLAKGAPCHLWDSSEFMRLVSRDNGKYNRVRKRSCPVMGANRL